MEPSLGYGLVFHFPELPPAEFRTPDIRVAIVRGGFWVLDVGGVPFLRLERYRHPHALTDVLCLAFARHVWLGHREALDGVVTDW